MTDRFKGYLEYIENTGGSPKVEWFDDDFAPIGPLVRSDMLKEGLIKIEDGKIYQQVL